MGWIVGVVRAVSERVDRSDESRAMVAGSMAQVTFAHQRAPHVTALGNWRTAATSTNAGRGRMAV